MHPRTLCRPAARLVACGRLGFVVFGLAAACSGDGGGGGDGGDASRHVDCPPAEQLLVHIASQGLDTNGDPNDLESETFVDQNQDGLFDAADGVDLDRDGQPDDFDGDGAPDNRFYFDDSADWVPDADSFDDYENVGIPRAKTPVASSCAADGIETGPLDLGFSTWKPSRCCRRK